MTLKIRMLASCAMFIAAVLAAGLIRAAEADTPSAAQEKERKLIGVLQSDAPPQDKAITCKQLAIYGTQDAVPALAPLLADKQLSSWARIALEVIPDSAAEDALLAALAKVQGRLLVGVINSLGARRDSKAVESLIQRLKDADAEVASAAAVALGRIGTAVAAQALEPALASAPAAVRSAVAEGCVLCAERSLAAGQAAEAVKLYDAVRKAEVPAQRVLEATRGAILARQSAGVPLLVEQLQSADRGRFAIGLRAARELAGREVTDALVAELGKATPERQALLILVLADRQDTAALPAVLQAAKGGSTEVRIMALQVLKRLGNASYVPVLLEAALDTHEELSQTAIAVLEELPGKDVDDDLAARLLKSEGKTRQILILLAGRRTLAAAVPALLKATEDRDGQIRAAALTALGFSIEFRDLPLLIARVVNPPDNAEEAKAAEAALRAACERMPDREACAEKLVAAMASAAVPAKSKFLEILSVMGGAKALQAVGAAARSTQPELKDTASRLLGEWMSVDAATVLLDLAKSASDAKYETRAMRGYIRLVRQFAMPDEQRAEMCRIALQTAKRDAEKKLILEVIGRYPSLDMLKLAVDTAKIPSLKDDAAGAALVIAQKIGGSADVQKLLAQVGQDPVKVEIIKAEYGADGKFKDVTQTVRKQVRDFSLIILPAPDYNSAFGGDPASGVVKQLKIQYRLNGKPGEASFPENATIMLPTPK
ncbi:MAG: HEAT repeat domain-containing protein [Planctomycetota bacterium]|nr:HEAT repeat domain-containing protein [Planctomycetota bacterium]